MEGKGEFIMNRFLLWVIDNIPLGFLAPYVFGMAIGRKPIIIKKKTKEVQNIRKDNML